LAAHRKLRGVFAHAAAVSQAVGALGVVVVTAPGEGEAMCAALEVAGLVDGCITTDVDVLLFGARTVHREVRLPTPTSVPWAGPCPTHRCEKKTNGAGQ
jgi:hypothetical protein